MYEQLDSETAVSRAIGHLSVMNVLLEKLVASLSKLPVEDLADLDYALLKSKEETESLVTRIHWLYSTVCSAEDRDSLLQPCFDFVSRLEGIRAAVTVTLPGLRGDPEAFTLLSVMPPEDLVPYAETSLTQIKENLEGIRRYLSVPELAPIAESCARLRERIRALSADEQ